MPPNSQVALVIDLHTFDLWKPPGCGIRAAALWHCPTDSRLHLKKDKHLTGALKCSMHTRRLGAQELRQRPIVNKWPWLNHWIQWSHGSERILHQGQADPVWCVDWAPLGHYFVTSGKDTWRHCRGPGDPLWWWFYGGFMDGLQSYRSRFLGVFGVRFG